ncbi:hypothetical protein D8674_015512 [Pyrus ussuriensis x Pyrus communis]|uniref:Uncharacterized protein n=1 Tax=Pyrus ussuriensis x Pyrus communis TaxID=2448454 RepID=A0A5N5GYK1_9ROSA|nr:hypothetical protein D8674_015512 [Pyrus ussuriensis x Pyrus communis]
MLRWPESFCFPQASPIQFTGANPNCSGAPRGRNLKLQSFALYPGSGGGLVVKTLNVARGRPVLRFKELKDIHERLDAKNGDSFPRIPPKDEFRGSLVNRDRVMGESPSRSTVRNVTVKTEPEVYDFDSSDGNAGRNNDLDGFGNITLKQIKETCKDKKRKRSTSVDLKKIETCSPVKHECSKLQTDEEDFDLIEPLSKWKLSKKAKPILRVSVRKTVSFQCLKLPYRLSHQNTSQVSRNLMVPDESPAIAADCVFKTETNENQICVVNEVCYEDMECADPTPIQIVTTSGWEIVEVDDSEFNSYECLDLPLLEYNVEGHITIRFTLTTSLKQYDERLCQTNSETQIRISEVVGNDLFQCMGPVNGTDSVSIPQVCLCWCRKKLVSRDSSDAADELTTLVSGGSPSLNQQRPPQRLFPTRKVISPTSQEKLCKAMKSIELHSEELPVKLGCAAGQKIGVLTTLGEDLLDGLNHSFVTYGCCLLSEIVYQSAKQPESEEEKINSHPKGIPKASKVSATPPRFTTGCTSIRTCSESAIAFSQLTDHEGIAEERLLPEAYHATPLKYNANESRSIAKRLLSMMSRDCNRFCKIMDKEGKKIVFADEAGEKLCHVKFYENDLATFSDQNLDFLVK